MTTETVDTTTLPVAGTYTIDQIHSTVGFVARHLVGAKVRGKFTEFSGTIVIAEVPEQSSVQADVAVASVETGQEQRDAHLRSGDFFEAESFPNLTLRSTGLTGSGGNEYVLQAELTVRGVTKPVDFDLTYLGSGPGMAPGSVVAAFEASAEIDRRDFGVSFGGALDSGGVIVGNKVRIELDVEAHKQ
ncbi:MAG TPA: YceI family protein [Acidimicrobiales bacterium]|nr:YceI family protein [Acidimicrobiales bacterium]